jgi:hypothetical protein
LIDDAFGGARGIIAAGAADRLTLSGSAIVRPNEPWPADLRQRRLFAAR